MGTGNYSVTSNEVGTLAVDGWAVTFGTARRGLGEAAARLGPSSLLAVPNVTAHPSTASVPITVLPYNGSLLCGFNVPVNGSMHCSGETKASGERASDWCDHQADASLENGQFSS